MKLIKPLVWDYKYVILFWAEHIKYLKSRLKTSENDFLTYNRMFKSINWEPQRLIEMWVFFQEIYIKTLITIIRENTQYMM